MSDGTVVHGWVVRDPDAAGPQPLLLDIHGGPHNAWNGAADDWHLYQQELAARGWTVLLLNPRASDGYGEAFFTAALGAWGEADAKDFLEPIDELVAEGIADPDRLAVTGYSYGGYMTCHLTSRDDRSPPRWPASSPTWRAWPARPITGTSSASTSLSAGLDARDRYDAMSPLAAVDRVRTPTLVYHGAADVRCPVGQAQQWHAALRERGVPSRLVLYPESSHLFVLDGRPSHRLDYNRRVVDWVEHHAGNPTGGSLTVIDADHWQQRLADLAGRHRVPGAAWGSSDTVPRVRTRWPRRHTGSSTRRPASRPPPTRCSRSAR